MYKQNIVFDLKNHREELLDVISKINNNLPRYMKGSLFVKNNYYYVKFYEDGKTISQYLGKNLTDDQLNKIKLELKNHKTLEKRKKEYLKELKEVEKMIIKYGGTL